MDDKLKELYKSVILEHDRSPFNYNKNESAEHIIQAYNEICGDRFDIFFDVKNGVISNICFHGYGCAISKASTSILIKKIKGQPIDDAKKIVDLFLNNIIVNNSNEIKDEEFTAFSAAREFPARLKCATLAWDEMNKFLTVNGK